MPRSTTVACGRSIEGRGAADLNPRRLFGRYRPLLLRAAVGVERADVSGEVLALQLILYAGEQHLVAGDLLLGIGDVLLEDVRIPDPARILHRVRVVESGFGAGLAADHATEIGPDLVGRSGTDRMARCTLREHLLARLRVLRRRN